MFAVVLKMVNLTSLGSYSHATTGRELASSPLPFVLLLALAHDASDLALAARHLRQRRGITEMRRWA